MAVRVSKIDTKNIKERLTAWAQEKGNGDRNILAIALFGSLARGSATPASDADILVLLRRSAKRFDDRIPELIPAGVGIGVDVFPYTLEEFYSSLKENWGMAAAAVAEGTLLYAFQDSEMSSFGDWSCALDDYFEKLKTKFLNSNE